MTEEEKAAKKDKKEKRFQSGKADAKKGEMTPEEVAKDLELKRFKMAEKAKKLAAGLSKEEEKSTAKLERFEKAATTVKPEKQEEELKLESSSNMLVPLEDYVKSGIYLGTKVITTDMRPFVYKRRSDGLAIINTKIIDEKLTEAVSFIAKYSPEKILVTCKREAGWKAVNAFGKATGVRVFTKKYPAGVITNSKLEEFFEPELVIVVDPWLDKNPMADANKINVPLVSICDTNNLTSSVDLILPGNNKSGKSIGLIFWLLARGYIQKRKMAVKVPDMADFASE